MKPSLPTGFSPRISFPSGNQDRLHCPVTLATARPSQADVQARPRWTFVSEHNRPTQPFRSCIEPHLIGDLADMCGSPLHGNYLAKDQPRSIDVASQMGPGVVHHSMSRSGRPTAGVSADAANRRPRLETWHTSPTLCREWADSDVAMVPPVCGTPGYCCPTPGDLTLVNGHGCLGVDRRKVSRFAPKRANPGALQKTC